MKKTNLKEFQSEVVFRNFFVNSIKIKTETEFVNNLRELVNGFNQVLYAVKYNREIILNWEIQQKQLGTDRDKNLLRSEKKAADVS